MFIIGIAAIPEWVVSAGAAAGGALAVIAAESAGALSVFAQADSAIAATPASNGSVAEEMLERDIGLIRKKKR